MELEVGLRRTCRTDRRLRRLQLDGRPHAILRILKRRRRRVVQVKLEVMEYPEVDTDEELLAETDEAVERTEEDDE